MEPGAAPVQTLDAAAGRCSAPARPGRSLAEALRMCRRLVAPALLGLAACAAEPPDVPVATRPELPPADFRTMTEQFAGLQRAALAADYAGFAEELGVRDPDNVTAELSGRVRRGAVRRLHGAGRHHRSKPSPAGRAARAVGAALPLSRARARRRAAGTSRAIELGRDRDAIARRALKTARTAPNPFTACGRPTILGRGDRR